MVNDDVAYPDIREVSEEACTLRHQLLSKVEVEVRERPTVSLGQCLEHEVVVLGSSTIEITRRLL